LAAAALWLCAPLGALADETAAPVADETPAAILVGSWLLLGPVSTPLPAFHDAEAAGYQVSDLTDQWTLSLDGLEPRLGQPVAWPGAAELVWADAPIVEGGVDLLAGDGPAEAYLATYLTVDRYTSVTVALTAAHPVTLAVDGEAQSLAAGEGEGVREATVELAIGKHLLLVRSVHDPEVEEPWQVAGAVTPGEGPGAELALSTMPARTVTIEDILEARHVESAAIAPDGKRVALILAETGALGTVDRWLELRRTKDGSLEHTWRGELALGQLRWAPTGSTLCYVTVEGEHSTIWAHDLDDGSTEALVKDMADLGDYLWAPDGTFLVVSQLVEAEPDERSVKRLRNPADRQPWFRDGHHLIQVSLDGVTRRLTAGPLSANDWSISPDSRSLMFMLAEPDMSERPFERRELWTLDLATLETTMILADPWMNAAAWGPEGQRIALLASPSAFGGYGVTVPEGTVPSEYDGQLYIHDLSDGGVTPVSRELKPSISTMHWSRADGKIYCICNDRQDEPVYAYDVKRDEWTRLDAGVDVVEALDVARGAPVAVVAGSRATMPQQVTLLDLRRGKARTLLDPAAERYADVEFGRVEPWSCKLSDGVELDGRVYYPPGFDETKVYPAIVYYYGGMAPITNDFGGRYPKNVWAGQGYVVYVPQPSGAVGYGQLRSADHVNEWGAISAREVIEGTEAFLAAHSFVDPERVGCMGASYGGFLTQYILTQTELFAAGISHAGISDLTSYWGEGLWGYLYGSVAMAHNYPWSNPDFFVEHSPLYMADQIKTPLLLVHGSVDSNVPPGESAQLFTALRLLGQDVEYVEILGQDHHILDPEQRVVWNDTLLAYFAKHLKRRPLWWETLYPDP